MSSLTMAEPGAIALANDTTRSVWPYIIKASEVPDMFYQQSQLLSQQAHDVIMTSDRRRCDVDATS